MATYSAGVRCAAGSSALLVRVSSERMYAGSTSRLAVMARTVTTGQARRAMISQRARHAGSAEVGPAARIGVGRDIGCHGALQVGRSI